MAIFELQGPDGRTYEIDAPDMQTAAKAFSGSQDAGRFAAPGLAQSRIRSWSDVPGEALQNLPSSAYNMGAAIFDAVSNPLQTAQNLGDVAAGGARNLARAALPEQAFDYLDSFADPGRKEDYTAKADAVGEFYKDRYGGSEELKRTLANDPVGFAGDLSVVLTGGGSLGARAPGVVGQAGKVVQSAGRTVDPIMATGRAVNSVGRAGAHTLGLTTGVGSTPITKAFDAGVSGNTAFRDHMRGTAPMDEVVTMAERGVDDLIQKRRAKYEAWNPLTGNVGDKPLKTEPLDKSVAFGMSFGIRDGVIKDKATASAMQQIAETVDTYKANGWTTAKDFDELKQIVYDIGGNAQQGSRAHKAVMGVYHSIGRQLKEQVPGYAQTMEDYAKASETIKEMRKTLSINDRASSDTTMRKLQSVMRNNVNTNYGARTKLVDELAMSEPNLPYALAGQAVNSPTPRGLQGLVTKGVGIGGAATFNPVLIASVLASSPRLAGELSYGAGRVKRLVAKYARKTGVPADEVAKALLAAYAAGEISSAPSE